jgi:signal transduction histidine kinase
MMCDLGLIRQVFVNLIGNAVKYTGKCPEAVIEVGQTTVQGAATLFVRDNGAGFDMNHTAKLFGPFQRLHHEHEFEGTGIGLAIVRRIVQRHGGRIWAEAEPGKGATFYFTREPTRS